ncbi:hypothetical protein DVH24_039359 [Malus domestica]|uniref:Uncharacterized protein n=1 Tax=Malus domestica TaxID=3750 RepID=A0A498HXW1_MALDO|nr:hypothetical protein DVH24_039359 [Malus domestica]
MEDLGTEVYKVLRLSACPILIEGSYKPIKKVCGAKNNHKATRGFLGKDDKFTLEAHRVSYTRAVENHLSTKSGVPKIGRPTFLQRGPAISYIYHPFFLTKEDSKTLANFKKLSKHFFSLNSNFGIGGSSPKAPPIHRGHMRLLAMT